MDVLTAIAASGMRARTETLDLLANNIANASTPGYKSDGESYDLFFGDSAWDGVNQNRPSNAEMPLIQKNWINYAQGTLLDTGNMGDLALTGSGFFAVQANSGVVYTRSGHFRVSKGGVLQTQEGYAIQGTDGKPIQVDANATFSIAKTGQVMQNGAAVGVLAVLSPDSQDGMIKRGGAYLVAADSTKMLPSTDAEVLQGKVESSNVEATQASVQLVGMLRQFEVMQRAMRIAGEMGKQAVEQVAKVG